VDISQIFATIESSHDFLRKRLHFSLVFACFYWADSYTAINLRQILCKLWLCLIFTLFDDERVDIWKNHCWVLNFAHVQVSSLIEAFVIITTLAIVSTLLIAIAILLAGFWFHNSLGVTVRLIRAAAAATAAVFFFFCKKSDSLHFSEYTLGLTNGWNAEK